MDKLVFITIFIISVILKSVSVTTVPTNYGLFEGLSKEINGKSIYSFYGIPFAKPPIGQLRFKKPVPIPRNCNNYCATEFKPQCYQPTNTSQMSEDCLYLNIWTPSLEESKNLPVMFWIYGGSFVSGSATQIYNGVLIYDGTVLALKDVVIVTSNYRLGVFGFLYGGSDEAPGNVGLWDQALALEWVKNNIKAFGGDPHNICIFGQSAGSVSVGAHILSPITRNMFKNAIMESGSTYVRGATFDREEALIFSKSFANNSLYFPTNTCNTTGDWVQCLKNMNVDQLNTAQIYLILIFNKNILYFRPIFGDEFLPKDANKAIIDGDFKTDVNLFMGFTEMDGLTYLQATYLNGRYNPQIPYIYNNSKALTYSDILSILIPNDNTLSKAVAQAYTDPFPNSSTVDIFISNQLRRSAAYAVGDFAFTCPTVLFGAKLVMNSNFRGNVYHYRLTYTYSISISYGSIWANNTHADDIALVFGIPLRDTTVNWTQTDQIVSRKIMKIWTDFAKYGSPPDIKNVKWPQFEYINGNITASYVELFQLPDINEKIYYNRYIGEDGYFPKVINSCLTFWNELITGEF